MMDSDEHVLDEKNMDFINDPECLVQDYLDEMLFDDTPDESRLTIEPEVLASQETLSDVPRDVNLPKDVNKSTDESLILTRSTSKNTVKKEVKDQSFKALLDQVNSAPESLFDDPAMSKISFSAISTPIMTSVESELESISPGKEAKEIVKTNESSFTAFHPNSEEKKPSGVSIIQDQNATLNDEKISQTENLSRVEKKISSSEIKSKEQKKSVNQTVNKIEHDYNFDWKEAPFNGLIFKVDGVKLVVPMILLGTIHPINESLTEVFGQATWFLGLLKVGAKTLKVADTRRIVIPDSIKMPNTRSYKYVIQIQGSDWGLACDDVNRSQLINPNKVRWRNTNRLRRPWVIGTVREEMCALIDVYELARAMKNSPDIF